jgi:hypothetical protein
MNRPRSYLLVVLVVTLATALLVAPALAAKHKGKKGPAVLDVTQQVGALVPERAPGSDGTYGLLTSTIEVGKRFKGRVIRDVNATVQTTGVTGNNPSNDLDAFLSAPNGATTLLFGGLGGLNPGEAVSIGPLTLDDDVPTHLFDVFNQGDPLALKPPFAGTAMPAQTLASLDGGPVSGTWVLRVLDTANGGNETSILNFWRLNVVAGKPYLAK